MRIENATPSTIDKIWQQIQAEISQSSCLEEAAQTLVSTLSSKFQESVVLARTFLTLPFNHLPTTIQRFVHTLAESADAEAALQPDTLILSLIGTSGEKASWNDRHESKSHVGIPLISSAFLAQIPMIAHLLKELGLPLAWVDTQDSDIVEKLGEVHGVVLCQ